MNSSNPCPPHLVIKLKEYMKTLREKIEEILVDQHDEVCYMKNPYETDNNCGCGLDDAITELEALFKKEMEEIIGEDIYFIAPIIRQLYHEAYKDGTKGIRCSIAKTDKYWKKIKLCLLPRKKKEKLK